MALDNNNSGARTPYTPPTIENIAIDMCDMNNPHQRPIYREYQLQTTVASLATHYEIKTALEDIMEKPRVVHNTQGGVKDDKGTPVNTMVHLLKRFAEKNPITQAELQRGFPALKSLQVAKKNANNSRGSTFRDHRLELTTASYLREPDKAEWQLRSSEIGWVTMINGSQDRAPVAGIYADATKIKDNDSLFIDSPRFSQFIFGALTDLSHGATLEEFSVVTGLSEDEILQTISNINESIIPSAKIDLKIHNRNGILILGRKGRKLLFDSSLETQVSTLKWKTLVAEMRDRVKQIMAREPAEQPAVEPAEQPAVEPAAETIVKHVEIITAPETTADSKSEPEAERPKEEIQLEEAQAEEAPAPAQEAELLAAKDTIKEKEAIIAELETKLTELETELTALKEKTAQIRAIAARNASHETRVAVTAEFEPTIREQKAEIKRLKSLETSLTSRNQHLQTLLRRPASEQAAEIQRELEKTQRDLVKAQADLEKAKITTASQEALTSTQREIADLKTKLEAAEKAKLAAETRATAAESRATSAESRANTAERRLQTAQEEAARLRSQLEAAQKVKPALAAQPKQKPASQAEVEALREAKQTIITLEQRIEDLTQALQSKSSHIIKMEDKGGMDAMRTQIVDLKEENRKLTQAQASSPAAESAQTALTIKNLVDQLAAVRKQLEASKKREEALAKLVGEDEPADIEGTPKTKKKTGKAGPGIESTEMSAEARTAAEEKVAATLAKAAAKAKGPEFKDLTKIEETIKNPDTRFLPTGMFEKMIGELNGLDFSEESLNSFVKKLSDIETAITENRNLSRERQAVQIKTKLQGIIKYIKGILSVDSSAFPPERKSGMIKRINQLLD